jgi:hypothetical protein
VTLKLLLGGGCGYENLMEMPQNFTQLQDLLFLVLRYCNCFYGEVEVADMRILWNCLRTLPNAGFVLPGVVILELLLGRGCGYENLMEMPQNFAQCRICSFWCHHIIIVIRERLRI